MTPWPFNDPPDVAVYTTRPIAEGKEPILYVSHDADDGARQFHAGGDQPVSAKHAVIVSLKTITDLDPSILELADLPLGWQAHRTAPNRP